MLDFSILPDATLSDVSAVTGLPENTLIWGVDSPGVVWHITANNTAEYVTATQQGLELARKRWA